MGYEFWQGAIAGENPEMQANEPQCGFYRRRFRQERAMGEGIAPESPFIPIAIWQDEDGTMRCKVGYDNLFVMRDAFEQWVWCGANPVSYAAYQIAAQSHQWPEEHSPLSDLFDTADALIRGTSDGGSLENLAGKLEFARKVENRKHLEAKRNIDATFRHWKERIEKRMKELKTERTAA